MGEREREAGVAQAETLAAPTPPPQPGAADALGATLTIAGREAAAPSGAPPPAVGAGRYQRGRQLGKGGMGRVVEAVDQQFNRVVAIKELLDPSDAERRQRFALEAMVTGNLEHPGIPSVYERGVEAGAPFYAMRRVVGDTLRKRLEAAPTLAERLALLPAVVRVAEALGYAHERGVIHRDVKPENVVVGRAGDVVLLDWGLARVRGLGAEGRSAADSLRDSAGGGASAGSTVHGSVVGTPLYMAPEQAAGETDKIDERTDVFALGAVLYHLLTGRAPYGGSSIAQVIEEAKAARPVPVTATERHAPARLVEICERAMARDPGARFKNAGELAAALEAAQAQALLAPSSGVSKLVTAVSLLVTAALAVAFAGLGAILPGFAAMGFGSVMVAAFAAAGVVLTAVEWRTLGRHHLGGLAVAALGLTLLSGLVNSGLGVLLVLEGLAGAEVVADATRYRALLSQGLWEALGSVVLAFMLASLQLLLWTVAQRRVSAAR